MAFEIPFLRHSKRAHFHWQHSDEHSYCYTTCLGVHCSVHWLLGRPLCSAQVLWKGLLAAPTVMFRVLFFFGGSWQRLRQWLNCVVLKGDRSSSPWVQSQCPSLPSCWIRPVRACWVQPCRQKDLTHVYRTLHLTRAEYTFYSSAHGTLSRIEHMIGPITGLR